MVYLDTKFTIKAVKNIDGYIIFRELCNLTHNQYGLRYRNFYNRLIKKCGSIKRIFGYVIRPEYNLIAVQFCSRRGFVYSTFIDKRGY